MAEPTKISVEQFLASLKQQGPVSAQITAAGQVDVSSITELDQKRIAQALRGFAGTKNGPMLIMGLPGALQALLSFAGIAMPGQDRLAYLRASPRQVVNRLVQCKDQKLLDGYPFEKVTKEDWTYYLSNTAELIEPCMRFLKKPESEGGFSDREVCDILERNEGMLAHVPVSRILPDCATNLLSKGKAQSLWEDYDFTSLQKQHWFQLLDSGRVVRIPLACRPFLTNEKGNGFTNDELILLARHCEQVTPWIDPESTSFKDVYELYLEGKAESLWKKFPFSSLKKEEWKRLIVDGKAEIPKAFSVAVNYGMFTVEELCELAERNETVYPHIPLDKLGQVSFVTHLLKTESRYLWEHYDFSRLNALSWERLICERKVNGIVPHVELLAAAKGLNGTIVEYVLKRDDRYLDYLPLNLVSRNTQIDMLASGRHETLWGKCVFSEFDKTDWERLFSKTTRIPAAFSAVVKAGMFTLPELCERAAKNPGFVQFLPLDKLDPKDAVELLLKVQDARLWERYDFGRLDGRLWADLICGSKGLIADRYLVKLRTAKGLELPGVARIIRKNPHYCTVVPLELIPHYTVVELLVAGTDDGRWLAGAYPFSLFEDDDWFDLFLKSTDFIPDEGKKFLGQDPSKLDRNQLNCLLARRPELVPFVNPRGVDPMLAIEVLIKTSSSPLWDKYDFSRFSSAQVVSIVAGAKARKIWPRAIVEKFAKCESALKDKEIQSVVTKNVGNALELLSVERIHDLGVNFFKDICRQVSKSKAATTIVIRKLTVDTKPWQELEREYHVALFEFVPACRKLIPWPSFELKYLDKLLLIDDSFKQELGFWRKFRLFVWRHWIFLLLLSIVTGSIIGCIAFELHKRERQRMTVVRREGIVSRVNDFCRQRAFSELDYLVDDLGRGEDAQVLKDGRVADSLSQLNLWRQKRKKAVDHLFSLKRIADQNWEESVLDSAETHLDGLHELDDVILPDERSTIQSYCHACEARRIEIAHREKNEKFQKRVDVIKGRCLGTSTALDALQTIVELGRMSIDAAIDPISIKRRDRANFDMIAHMKGIFGRDLSKMCSRIKSAKTIREIEDVCAGVRLLSASPYADDKVKKECGTVLEISQNCIEALKEAEIKRQVTVIHTKVNGLLSELKIVDGDRFTNVVASAEAIPSMASFTSYRQEHNAEYCSLTEDISNRKHGITSADRLIDTAEKLFSEIMGRGFKEGDIQRCANAIQAVEDWEETFSSLVSWKELQIDASKSRLKEVMNVSEKRLTQIKAQIANIHSQVETLLATPAEDAEAFNKMEASFNSIASMPSFARYLEASSNEYASLESSIVSRQEGIRRVDSLILSVQDFVKGATTKTPHSDDVRRCLELKVSLEEWLGKYSSLIKWEVESAKVKVALVERLKVEVEERLSLISSANHAHDYKTLHDAVQTLLRKYSDRRECQYIDQPLICSESQVETALTKPGWFSSGSSFEFVGLVMINPTRLGAAVPLITVESGKYSDVYNVCPRYDPSSREYKPAMKKIFEYNGADGYRKIAGVDYDKCQGIGLFVCTDKSYVDVDSWKPGTQNPECPHWVADLKPGEWIVEPGYERAGMFDGPLGKVKWVPGKTFLKCFRTDTEEGRWLFLGHCPSCRGTGKVSFDTTVWCCPRCLGEGSLKMAGYYGGRKNSTIICPKCRGNAKRYGKSYARCESCKGTGNAWRPVKEKDRDEVVQLLMEKR